MIYPTIKQLRYFTALCETQHFGRAADACNVSQSAFSTAIQDFESILDVQLVDRTNRQVTITTATLSQRLGKPGGNRGIGKRAADWPVATRCYSDDCPVPLATVAAKAQKGLSET